MTTTRQDAWSKDEDILLAEVVLRLIREGGTQLQAFEEVGKLLSRTSAACGFRWNSYVRKQYKPAIELAKSQRKQLKKGFILVEEPVEEVSVQESTAEFKEDKDFEEILQYLKSIYDKSLKYEEHYNDDAVKEKSAELEAKYSELYNENQKLQKELQTIEEAYKALVELMEKARKMVVFKEEEKQQNA
ncbi:RsfA family transcriptional regulator [Niallia circulans]|uniref:RsfA family transcriptional regulator n=1 Tax=Niallia circulans TaxID=1397 RepID=A0A553SPC3_NIACI|nr:RsfA family transcriptional regulator [Niallia circulans]TRZ38828.1 RsfA family transcriptional regulator [Niallia circulans]